MSNVSDINPARAFAFAAHHGQRYGKHSYMRHLDAAAEVYKRYSVMEEDEDYEVLSAIYLHDVLEDTKISFIDILEVFGSNVAGLVQAVTDKPGKNRHERHIITYPGILAVGKNAIIVKLADRISNIEAAYADFNEGKLDMYRREYLFFREALHNQKVIHSLTLTRMWTCLDRLLGYVEKK